MKTLILEASGHIRFSWESEHAISHLRQPLHFESSLAIQIGSFLFAKRISSKNQRISHNDFRDSILPDGIPILFTWAESSALYNEFWSIS
jgi:hypothetical protein